MTATPQSELDWIRSTDDGSLIRSLEGHGGGVARSPSIRTVGSWLCGTGDGSVLVWDLTTGDLSTAPPGTPPP